MDSPYYHLVPKEYRANLRWRRAVLQRAMDDPDFADAMVQACSEDILFYINTFVWTYDPRREPYAKLPFITYDYQDTAILALVDSVGQRDVCIEKSRDMGASWICLVVFEWLWHFWPLQSLLMVSRTESYVDESGNPKCLFWKVDFIHDNLPVWLMPYGFDRSKHRKKLHLRNPANGSVIDGESTTGDVARGDRRSAILLDEFAAVTEGHKVLMSTRDATNTRIFNSTPQGTGNAHYDVTQTDIYKLRLHWSQHPLKRVGLYSKEGGRFAFLDDDYWCDRQDRDREVEEMDLKLGRKGVELHDGKLRSVWYVTQCDRAAHAAEIAQELDIDYLGSGFQFFSGPQIAKYIREHCVAPHKVGDVAFENETGQPLGFRENPQAGRLKLWLYVDLQGDPPRDRKYTVGADVSAGTGASNSVLSILDTKTGEKVGEFVTPHIRPEAFGRTAVAICRWLGNAYLIWESNGPGRQFGAAVVESGYRNIYWRRSEEAVSKKLTDIPGHSPTRENKVAVLSEYRRALEEGEFTNHSEDALQECLEYVYTPQGAVVHARAATTIDPSGAKENHGDRVIADALAWKAMKDRPVPKTPLPKTPPPGSFAYRRQQWERSHKEKRYWVD